MRSVILSDNAFIILVAERKDNYSMAICTEICYSYVESVEYVNRKNDIDHGE